MKDDNTNPIELGDGTPPKAGSLVFGIVPLKDDRMGIVASQLWGVVEVEAQRAGHGRAIGRKIQMCWLEHHDKLSQDVPCTEYEGQDGSSLKVIPVPIARTFSTHNAAEEELKKIQGRLARAPCSVRPIKRPQEFHGLLVRKTW